MLISAKHERAPMAIAPQHKARRIVSLSLSGVCYLVVSCLISSAPAYSQNTFQCGSLENGYGPFDYTNPVHFAEKLPIVDNNHFTAEVESFQGHNKCGGNGCEVASDIDYTLRAFPNHHRALFAMARYHVRDLHKSRRPMRYSAECYFDRALRFKPDDSTVHMVFGYFLSKIGDPERALEQYETAVELVPNSAEAHYNLGLLYVERRDYEQARTHALRAYALGFPLPGLRRKLENVGHWKDDRGEMPTE